jgi:hypothetical protein
MNSNSRERGIDAPGAEAGAGALYVDERLLAAIGSARTVEFGSARDEID